MRATLLIRYSAKLSLALALAASMGCAAAKAPLQGGEWGTYLYNDSRANYNPDGLKTPLASSWDRSVGDFKFLRPFPKEQLSAPALADGTLYAGSSNKSFYAVSLSDGKVKWKFDAGSPIEAAPAVSAGNVYFGASDGWLRSFDRSGKLLWKFQARSEIVSTPVVRDGKVFFTSSDDRAYALDEKTGEKLWSYSRNTYKTVTSRVYASPAWSQKGIVFFFFSDGSLAAVSAEGGKELWVKRLVKDMEKAPQTRRTPLVENGMVYTVDEGGAVLALSEDTGETRGVYNQLKARDFVLAGKKTLVIAGEEQIIALDRLSGAILWKAASTHGQVASVFAAGDTLFVLSNYKKMTLGIEFLVKQLGYIEALSLSDGKAAWGEELGSRISANGSSAYSRVALLTDKGLIKVFEPK